jgi:hypothetical protein
MVPECEEEHIKWLHDILKIKAARSRNLERTA